MSRRRYPTIWVTWPADGGRPCPPEFRHRPRWGQTPGRQGLSEGLPKMPPVFLRIRDAAAATGLRESFIRRTFLRKRPKNVPPPPPHRRVGRTILIVAEALPEWAAAIGAPTAPGGEG